MPRTCAASGVAGQLSLDYTWHGRGVGQRPSSEPVSHPLPLGPRVPETLPHLPPCPTTGSLGHEAATRRPRGPWPRPGRLSSSLGRLLGLYPTSHFPIVGGVGVGGCPVSLFDSPSHSCQSTPHSHLPLWPRETWLLPRTRCNLLSCPTPPQGTQMQRERQAAGDVSVSAQCSCETARDPQARWSIPALRPSPSGQDRVRGKSCAARAQDAGPQPTGQQLIDRPHRASGDLRREGSSRTQISQSPFGGRENGVT